MNSPLWSGAVFGDRPPAFIGSQGGSLIVRLKMPRLRVALTTVALSSVAIAVGGCSDSWEGFVYPNRSDLTRHRSVGKFDSLEACRAAARALLANLNALERGDYECGKNCDDGSRLGGVKVCKETLR